jgi:hypothetical protein
MSTGTTSSTCRTTGTERLTLDYGVRFYAMTPQWDTTLQVSNFLPDQFNKAAAARLFPVCIGASPCSTLTGGHGPDTYRQGVTPTLANTVEAGSSSG